MEIPLYKNAPAKNTFDPLRGDIHLTPEISNRLSTILQTAADNIPADFVLLTDRTGQMIASIGAMSDHKLTALGSLMAADFAANEEIGRLFGCREKNARVMLRECESSLILMLPAGPRMAFLVHTPSTVAIGWARLIALDAVSKIVEGSDFSSPSGNVRNSREQIDISSEVEQAFDDLWME